MAEISSDQDEITIARLAGHVSLVLTRRWPHETAVESLRTLAADRVDLLAQWAGILLGSHDPCLADWPGVAAQIRLLVDCGAQIDAVSGWAMIGRQRSGPWAAQHWPPIPALADAIGAPPSQVRHDPAGEDHRDGWWHLVVHPLPHFRHGQDPYPAMAREFGRVQPDGLGFDDLRRIRDDHRVVFGMRCRDAIERLERARAAITPLLPDGTTTTLT